MDSKNDVLRIPNFQTHRLELQQVLPGDWREVAFLRSDKEINRFIQRTSAPSKKEALAFISRISIGIAEGEVFYWKITELNRTKMIGSICLWNFSEKGSRAEVGYDLHPAYHGRGLMSEALQQILQYGFAALNIRIVEAYTQWQNNASISLLLRNGFILVENERDADNADNRVYRCFASDD